MTDMYAERQRLDREGMGGLKSEADAYDVVEIVRGVPLVVWAIHGCRDVSTAMFKSRTAKIAALEATT